MKGKHCILFAQVSINIHALLKWNVILHLFVDYKLGLLLFLSSNISLTLSESSQFTNFLLAILPHHPSQAYSPIFLTAYFCCYVLQFQCVLWNGFSCSLPVKWALSSLNVTIWLYTPSKWLTTLLRKFWSSSGLTFYVSP